MVTSGYSAEAGRSGGRRHERGHQERHQRPRRLRRVLPARRRHGGAAAAVAPRRRARGCRPATLGTRWTSSAATTGAGSLGGPIRRDRTHFFLSYDQTAQGQPFLRDIRGRGQYDAVLAAFPELVAGYRPNDDGVAAADPERGRTASGRFLRETDNLILFGKLNHRASERHALTLRYNLTDYARVSDFVGEESRRFVESHSTVGSVVSVVGESGVNELRVQLRLRRLRPALAPAPRARCRPTSASTTRRSARSASPGGCPSPTTSGSSRSRTGSRSSRATTSFAPGSP